MTTGSVGREGEAGGPSVLERGIQVRRHERRHECWRPPVCIMPRVVLHPNVVLTGWISFRCSWWKDELIKELNPTPYMTLLDVAGGTGKTPNHSDTSVSTPPDIAHHQAISDSASWIPFLAGLGARTEPNQGWMLNGASNYPCCSRE